MFEFAILGNEGKPDIRLGINVALHTRLIAESRLLDLGIFERFSDYYSDGEVGASELSKFIQEIDIMRESLGQHDELTKILTSIRGIAVSAKSRNQPLYGLAD